MTFSVDSARVSRTAALSVPTFSAIPWDTTDWDPSGWHNPTVNPDRITALRAGVTLIGGVIGMGQTTVGRRAIGVAVNGAGLADTEWFQGEFTAGGVATLAKLNYADSVTLTLYQEASGSLALEPAQCRMYGARLGDLASPDSVKVHRLTALSIPSGVVTPVGFPEESWDPSGMHASGAAVLTFNKSGTWLVGAGLRWAAAAGGRRVHALTVNGTDLQNSLSLVEHTPGGSPGATIMAPARVHAGDTVQLVCFHTQGAAVSLVASQATHLWAHRLGN